MAKKCSSSTRVAVWNVYSSSMAIVQLDIIITCSTTSQHEIQDQ